MVMVCSGATLCPIEVVTWLGFAQADSPKKNKVGFVLDKREAEVILHLEAVNPRGPVPAELLQGFDDGEARQANTACGRTITAHVGLAFDKRSQVVDVCPGVLGCLG